MNTVHQRAARLSRAHKAQYNMTLASARLALERKQWRKDHPFGFVAKPRMSKTDGSIDLFTWDCIVPGKDKTICEGGEFPVTIKFSSDYPSKPPTVLMPKGFFHVNVFNDSGAVCLSILKETVPDHLGKVSGWNPSITVKQILVSVQQLLHDSNFGSIASWPAYHTHKASPAAYEQKIREQTAKFTNKRE
jgi:ubiquitin-conjugating enzyme E2 I